MSRSYYVGDGPNHYHHQSPQPDHFQQRLPARTSSQSRIPRPTQAVPDRMHGQPPMRTEQHTAPVGQILSRAQEPYDHEPSAWDASQNLYDGSGYDDEYGQYGQWPLSTAQPHTPSPRSNSRPRKAPQRPQRPDESSQHSQPTRDLPQSTQPLAASNRQFHAPVPPSHIGTGQWTGDGYNYPPQDFDPPRRAPQHTFGTADPQAIFGPYSEPQAPQQTAQRYINRVPLGPPPSARRGPSSYYPQIGPVHPIAEETDSMRSSIRNPSIHTNGHSSASSNAIPIGIPQAYLNNHLDYRPDSQDRASTSDEVNDDASVYASTNRHLDTLAGTLPSRDPSSPEVLVRQASVGKKSKPTLTTVKTGERVRKVGVHGISSLPSQLHPQPTYINYPSVVTQTQLHRNITEDKLNNYTQAGAKTSEESLEDTKVLPLNVSIRSPNPPRDGAGSKTPEEILQLGTGLIDPSSSESESEVKKKRSKELLGTTVANESYPHRSRTRSPFASKDDEKVNSILESLEKGGAIRPDDAEELSKPTAGLSERAGKRRPPRLDVDAVRAAEARGSLTSLPDLIKRATKLASNLDRGKTASRLGVNWFEGADDEKRRSTSLADMLSAFPPPVATPTGSRGETRGSFIAWSSRLRHSPLPDDSNTGAQLKPRRRCCGMPLWAFILLILLLFVLVAAAVIVPVVLLVVIPNQDNSHSTANEVGSCERKPSCENGGTNILSSSGYCQCLCINGYTGLTCTTYSKQGCTTTSLGSINNATVGTAIPRLLQGAESNFSVPLNTQAILGLFSSLNLSCTSQNALVTFNGLSSRRDVLGIATAPQSMDKRQANMRNNGLSLASGFPTATPMTSSTATSTSSADVAASTQLVDGSTTLDFARVAVLYVLQASSELNNAATAQENLQKYFHEGDTSSGDTANAKNISLGTGLSCDLTSTTLTLENGTTVGEHTWT